MNISFIIATLQICIDAQDCSLNMYFIGNKYISWKMIKVIRSALRNNLLSTCNRSLTILNDLQL